MDEYDDYFDDEELTKAAEAVESSQFQINVLKETPVNQMDRKDENEESDDESLSQFAESFELSFLQQQNTTLRAQTMNETQMDREKEDSDDENLAQWAESIELSYIQQENTLRAQTKNSTELDVLELASAVYNDQDDYEKPSLEHLNCLISYFKHSAFHTNQWEIIRTVMIEKHDAMAVMPTGYGKSLCFQFPAAYKSDENHAVLVVSPLIALMEAQILDLNRANIPACLVGSAQEDRQILSRIKNAEFKIVYSSPEYLCGENGIQLLDILKNRLLLIAIDESHCVSQWGTSFRPTYRKLGVIRETVKDTPILAMTATATPQMRTDIARTLKLRQPRQFLMSTDRPNLKFLVRRKSSSFDDDLAPWITNITSGSVIVYVLKRDEANEISNHFQAQGVNCRPYHAGLEMKERKATLRGFLDDQIEVIIATVAFGMGIDKKDIRTIVHYGSPKNLESYYQEVGRAGRDAKETNAGM